MLGEEANKTHLGERVVQESKVHVGRPCVPPRATRVHGSSMRLGYIYPSLPKLLEPGAWRLPLSPHEAAQFPSDPCIQLLKAPHHDDHSVVSHPTPNDGVELLDSAVD